MAAAGAAAGGRGRADGATGPRRRPCRRARPGRRARPCRYDDRLRRRPEEGAAAGDDGAGRGWTDRPPATGAIVNPPQHPRASGGDAAPDRGCHHRRRRWRPWVSAVAVVAGCVLGAATLGACSSDPTQIESTPHPLQSPGQSPNLSLQTALDKAEALGVLHGDDSQTVPGDLTPLRPLRHLDQRRAGEQRSGRRQRGLDRRLGGDRDAGRPGECASSGSTSCRRRARRWRCSMWRRAAPGSQGVEQWRVRGGPSPEKRVERQAPPSSLS